LVNDSISDIQLLQSILASGDFGVNSEHWQCTITLVTVGVFCSHTVICSVLFWYVTFRNASLPVCTIDDSVLTQIYCSLLKLYTLVSF